MSNVFFCSLSSDITSSKYWGGLAMCWEFHKQSDIDQQNTGDVYGGFLKWWYSKPSKSLHHFGLDTYSFGVQFKKPPYGRMIALS
jgi:hypothetical protein